jgi:phospholysine phosphohistidine inorganic pyrophosphate phosphatase
MKAILFDMDGVVYNAEQPIAGAAEALQWVRKQGIPHLFVTNTTSRARNVLIAKLARFGIDASEADILTPCVAAMEWLRSQERGGVALFLRPAVRHEFEGLDCLPEHAESGARYVVIGDLGDLWDFRTLNRAFRLLHADPEATLIALGMTRFWQAEDGIALDVAPFVAALEHASGRKARVFGKPAEAFFRAATAALQVDAADAVMIGDDIVTDVGGAQAAGLRGVLVKTGKFRAQDLAGEVQPDVVLDSIADLPAWWEKSAS